MKNVLILLLALLIKANAFTQAVGSKVSIVAVDGKTYTGKITEIQGDKYKVKYDGFTFDAWLTTEQFQVVQTTPPAPLNNREVNRQPQKVQPASPAAANSAAANPVQQKTTGIGTPNIRGAWSYVGFIEKGGKITRMGSRMSSLNLGADGKYVVNTWLGGSNNMRQAGTYTFSGNRLTMITSDGEVRKYTLSFSADGEMSMTNEKGEGYVAAR